MHVYGRDDTRIIVYSMDRWPKEEREMRKNQDIFVIIIWTPVIKIKNLTLWHCSSNDSEDRFSHFICICFSYKNNGYYLSCWIELVLSLTLYKFIIWAYWAKIQFHIGSNPISVLTKSILRKLLYREFFIIILCWPLIIHEWIWL